jgi:hypothetical protein
MAKLDRLRWEGAIAFTAFGVSAGIRVSNGSVIERLRAILPPGWKPATTPTVGRLYSLIAGGPSNRQGLRRFNILYADATRLLRTHDLEETLHQLQVSLELFIGDRAPRRTFVHAGVVGWKGKAIVIPGRSHSGKSSLVTALVQAGAVYYSDEFAVLDERGRVHPYPIPLALRQDTRSLPTKYKVEELGGRVGDRPLPVGLVVITRYVDGARFRPRLASAGHAVMAMLGNTLPARRRPKRVLDVLTRAVSQALALRGARGEAEEAVCRLLATAETAA